MDAHRLVAPLSLTPYDLREPFSCFDFVDEHFPAFPGQHLSGIRAARRIFSLARSFNAATLVLEDIYPDGLVQDEIKGDEGQPLKHKTTLSGVPKRG